MKAINIANKLVSTVGVSFISLALIFPGSAQAEYYLVSGMPACDACASAYYPPVHKHKHKVRHTAHKAKRYYYTSPRRHSHYTMTVYYPVATYVGTNPCGCCGGFMAPAYVWVPAPPYRVYYGNPNDRLVGNRYEENLHDPSLDTGTADNDIY